MPNILMVIVGFFYFGIVRGWKFSLEGRLNYCKPMMKKQGVPFYRMGSPFEQKKFYFWFEVYPLSYRVGSNFQREWGYLASALRRVLTSSRFKEFSILFPPHSLLL